MSKLCQNCGKPMADDMRFCQNCGAPYQAPAAPQQPQYQAPQQPQYQAPQYQQPQYQAPQQPQYQQAQYGYQAPQQGYQPAAPKAPKAPKQGSFDLNKIIDQVKMFANGIFNRCKTDKKFMGICIGIVALFLVVVIGGFILLSGGGHEAPIKTYISIMMKGKGNKIKDMAPPAYWEYMEDEEDLDIDDVIDEFEDEWEDYIDEMEDEYGKNVRMTYEVTKVKDLSDKKVEKIAEALDDQYDIDEKSVKAAKELDVEFTIKGSEDDDDNETEITVVKIGSKWYWINYYESGDSYRVYFQTGG